MRAALAVLTLLPAFAAALEPAVPFDLTAVCAGRAPEAAVLAPRAAAKMISLPDGGFAVLDQGFCAAYAEAERGERPPSVWSRPLPAFEELLAASSVIAPPRRLPGWKIRLYASNSFTTYFHSDVTFHSSRYDVEIKDYEWAERSSREFFSPNTWAKPGNNPLQVFDEPTNAFVVSIEKNGHEFFLSAFHPKFLQASGQVKEMKGTIDGVAVDGRQPVSTPFHGYEQTPGESKIQRNENTYREMSFEIGYGHRFKLFDTRFGSMSYVPGIAVGVMVGQNLSVVVQEGKWWDFDDHGDSYGVQGFGGSLTNRLEFNAPKEAVGIFYENKLSRYSLEHGFLDGTQKYVLGFTGNSVGLKFMLYDSAKHRRRKIDDCPLW